MSALSQQLVLKEGSVFLLSHQTGDITGNTGLGLYYRDIRYLSHYTFKINEQEPPLLNFSGYRNFMGTLQFANDIFQLADGKLVLPQTISIRRSRFISGGLHERFGLASYNRFPVPITLSLSFGADFRDIFDIRGFQREKWGQLLPPVYEDDRLMLRYQGLDGLSRSTIITFDRQPDSVEVQMPRILSPIVEPGIMVPVVGAPSYHIIIEPPVATATWHFVLETNRPVSLALHIMPYSEGEEQLTPGEVPEEAQPEPSAAPAQPQGTGSNGRFDRAVRYMQFSYRNWEDQSTRFSTDHEEFNAVLRRSRYDLRVLSDPLGEGYFPSAGIPWYACPFGRDSLITALQTLSLNPRIAVGTLKTLARYQGQREDPWREEQPGKILHEMRFGEMVRLGMVPHSPYYGTVDATPLFIMLFVEAMRWLDDDSLYNELLPNVWRAIEWIDRYGDVDGDGFVEYVASTNRGGIRNQVWKDSSDSIQFPDGTLAETPVAAVEVQGYVYAARKGLSELLRRKGDVQAADWLAGEAERLKERFNQAFWMPDEGFFTQGLDRNKRQVPAITSNPGHCLWCGIVDEHKARLTVQRLMQDDMVSGWGIRTLSSQYPSYNPMSYHNGSVWPHDNSIVVAGFKRYGYHDEANRIITQIVEAAGHFMYARLPELYCGFTRDNVYHSGPAEYPVSCSPQAWAAGAPILMLQTILGLEADAAQKQVRLNPRLPGWLNRVEVANLAVGSHRLNFVVECIEGQEQVRASPEDSGITVQMAGSG
jgi:glycogen debranching enzyme